MTIRRGPPVAVAVPAHAGQHYASGSDAIDITDLAGFPGGTSDYLRADGTFAAPPAGGGGPGTGDVVGPAASVNQRVAIFSGTTGKLLADSGVLISDVVLTSDARLSNARTPTAHAASHAAAGADPITLAESQVTNLVADLSAIATSLAGKAALAHTHAAGDVTSGVFDVARGGTGTGTAFTTGSIVFAGASGVYAQDNAQLFWDDTNDRLGIGLNNPNAISNANTTVPKVAIAASGASAVVQVMRHTAPGGGGALLQLCSTRGVAADDYTISQNGDGLGTFNFQGTDGTTYGVGAQIIGAIDAVPSAGNLYGRLVFLTSNGGLNLAVERMRIDHLGNVGIGATSFGASATRVLGIANGTAPTSSPGGGVEVYAEAGVFKCRGSGGAITTIANASGPNVDLPSLAGLANQSTADQTISAATTALLTGSALTLGDRRLRIGTIVRVSIAVAKTAAGTAGNVFAIKVGTLGTTGDATILTFTLPAGTAVADVAWIEILLTVRGPLSASCVVRGQLSMSHNLATTGFATTQSAVLQGTSSVFDATPANLILSVACTTAASTVLTFSQVIAEAWNV